MGRRIQQAFTPEIVGGRGRHSSKIIGGDGCAPHENPARIQGLLAPFTAKNHPLTGQSGHKQSIISASAEGGARHGVGFSSCSTKSWEFSMPSRICAQRAGLRCRARTMGARDPWPADRRSNGAHRTFFRTEIGRQLRAKQNHANARVSTRKTVRVSLGLRAQFMDALRTVRGGETDRRQLLQLGVISELRHAKAEKAARRLLRPLLRDR